jgi:hypothetical protein
MKKTIIKPSGKWESQPYDNEWANAKLLLEAETRSLTIKSVVSPDKSLL